MALRADIENVSAMAKSIYEAPRVQMGTASGHRPVIVCFQIHVQLSRTTFSIFLQGSQIK
jgi:hypothetical protein